MRPLQPAIKRGQVARLLNAIVPFAQRIL